MKAIVLGDSQGVGEAAVLAPVLARHGYTLDTSSSWTQNGAGIDALIQHAASVGAADLVLVFSGGANDPASLIASPSNYRAKLNQLVSTLRSGGAASVVFVGPMRSDDPAVSAQHDAAREIQGAGIPGATWIDGYRLSGLVPHPAGNPTHWGAPGYRQIALELERAIWSRATVTAVGLIGTLTFLGALAMLAMEALYENAASAE